MLAALFGKGQKELKVLYILITLTLAAILLYPLGCVLFQSVLTKEGGIGLANYTSLLSQSSFWTALANSFTVSGISVAIATLMAFFCAYGLHFTRIRPGVKKVIQIIVLLPLFLPSITYGFAVIYSFGRLGLISQLIVPPPFSIYGFWGLLIADVIYTLPPAFLILYNAFFYVDRNFITVSKLMGDGPWQTFYMTAIRPVVGSLLSAFILSFFLSFTDFGIPVSIAGEYEVIATQLYTTMMGAIPNFGEGAVIAMAMLVPSVASVVMLRWVDRFNFRYNKISKAEVSTNAFRDALYLLYYVLISLALLSVFVVMFVVPFVKQWPYQPYFTLDVITRIVSDSSIWQVYEHSIGVALVSAAVGTIFCYAAALVKARSQLPSWCQTTMDSFAMITNTVPGMVLGIGFLFAMSGTPLANTFTILVLANLVHFLTTPYMMATSALSKMNAGWETTGALMGDSWIKTVSRVIVPNSLPTLLQMFQYFFVSAMVTISAVVFLTGARTMLLTTKIKELQYFEKFEEIFVLSLLVFLTNVAAKLIFDALTSYVQTHHGQGLLTRLKTFFQSATTRKANQSI
ncbi:MAG TPA: ABC transporter permease subunit [Candidatus Aphodousia faecalis]|nr:ABC transporter permease subunit [Candidatus Aphodousia faecalis]